MKCISTVVCWVLLFTWQEHMHLNLNAQISLQMFYLIMQTYLANAANNSSQAVLWMPNYP